MAEYIEREILLNTLDEVCRVACPYSGRRDIAQYVKCGACPLGSSFDFVDDIPAADVRPVVHGKWLIEHGLYRSGYPRFVYHCSKCGKMEEHAYYDSKCSNFCPNCGADMRKEEG